MIKRKENKIIVILFWIYAVLMLYLMFGQRIPSLFDGGWFKNYASQVRARINIVPLKTIGEFVGQLFKRWDSFLFVNLVGNVVMFVPLGFFLPYFNRRSKKLFGCLGVAFLIILCAEITQALTLLGFFDVDDFILNLIGAMLGFWTQVLYNRHFQFRSK